MHACVYIQYTHIYIYDSTADHISYIYKYCFLLILYCCFY